MLWHDDTFDVISFLVLRMPEVSTHISRTKCNAVCQKWVGVFVMASLEASPGCFPECQLGGGWASPRHIGGEGDMAARLEVADVPKTGSAGQAHWSSCRGNDQTSSCLSMGWSRHSWDLRRREHAAAVASTNEKELPPLLDPRIPRLEKRQEQWCSAQLLVRW